MQPSIVLLLPVTRSFLAPKYIDGLNQFFSSPVNKRVVVINKTSGRPNMDLLKVIKANSLDYVILERPNTGIFEGFMGLSILPHEWIMQIHDDDWTQGCIKYFKPESNYELFIPKGIQYRTQILRRPNSNEWVFSAISGKFWNLLLSYFEFIGEKPMPSSDYTLNSLIQVLGVKKRLRDYHYYYSHRNWSAFTRKNHLNNILYENGWGVYSNSRIATLNMKIDSLAFIAFVLRSSEFNLARLNLISAARQYEVEIQEIISNYMAPSLKSNLSRMTGFSEKLSESESQYFEIFASQNSIKDLVNGVLELAHLETPALTQRAMKWGELLKEIK
jgi:hypothetical protein